MHRGAAFTYKLGDDMKNWITVVMMSMAFVCVPADAAKRLGGGKSMGQQSNQVTQREAAKPSTPNAAPNAAPHSTPPAPAAAPAHKKGKGDKKKTSASDAADIISHVTRGNALFVDEED